VLGELKDPAAVEPLMKVLLDPAKSSIATTALLALVKIGKPSVDRAVKVMDGSDKALIDFNKQATQKLSGSKEEVKGNPALPIAAAVVGMAGRPEGIAPMIKVLESDAPAADKAVVARELAKIPATAESKAAFKKAFESIPSDTSVQGTPALALLAESAGQFYDPSLVPWLLERAAAVKGGEDAKAIQQSLVTTALKVAKPDQLESVKKAAASYDAKDLVPLMEEVLKACGEKVDCYVVAIEKTEYQSKDKQLGGIKAGYMIGVLGDAAARDKLIDGLGSIENAAVRFVAAQTIDQLTPKGSNEVVTRLDQIIAKNKKSGDQDKVAGDAPLQQVSYRLSARGG
jgi:HEAT repeat protein